jgi:hypothetical protein
MGNLGFVEFGLILILWALPIAVAVWLVRMVSDIARAQRTIADSLRRLEDRLSSGSGDTQTR